MRAMIEKSYQGMKETTEDVWLFLYEVVVLQNKAMTGDTLVQLISETITVQDLIKFISPIVYRVQVSELSKQFGSPLTNNEDDVLETSANYLVGYNSIKNVFPTAETDDLDNLKKSVKYTIKFLTEYPTKITGASHDKNNDGSFDIDEFRLWAHSLTYKTSDLSEIRYPTDQIEWVGNLSDILDIDQITDANEFPSMAGISPRFRDLIIKQMHGRGLLFGLSKSYNVRYNSIVTQTIFDVITVVLTMILTYVFIFFFT